MVGFLPLLLRYYLTYNQVPAPTVQPDEFLHLCVAV